MGNLCPTVQCSVVVPSSLDIQPLPMAPPYLYTQNIVHQPPSDMAQYTGRTYKSAVSLLKSKSPQRQTTLHNRSWHILLLSDNRWRIIPSYRDLKGLNILHS